MQRVANWHLHERWPHQSLPSLTRALLTYDEDPAPAPVRRDMHGHHRTAAVPDVVLSARDRLIASISEARVELADGAAVEGLLLAQYNELFALPWARENEVWLQVRPETVAG